MKYDGAISSSLGLPDLGNFRKMEGKCLPTERRPPRLGLGERKASWNIKITVLGSMQATFDIVKP